MNIKNLCLIAVILLLSFPMNIYAQENTNLSSGPYKQLIIRGVTLINGNGAPPIGPVDIVVEQNKIVDIQVVGYPGVEIDPKRRPQLKEGGEELMAEGMYLLPGFIDMHGHIGGTSQGAEPDYVFKLWMSHGITTVREPSGRGLDFALKLKEQSKKNEIIAPRIIAYTGFGHKSKSFNPLNDQPINTPELAREWVRANAKRGADGVKFFGAEPEIMKAALDENKKLGLGSACHHAQMSVARWNVLHSARAGLTSLWEQAAPPYSDHWNAVMNELLELDFTLDPTFNIYEASRDLHKARRAEWHETYTLPSLWEFYQPSKISHGSYWHYWGTEQEIAWKKNYQLWMTFVNEYKNRGGRVTAGSDSGFIFQLYGFAYIRELELLREAGFHPLEVIRAATLNGAEALGMDDQIGSVEIGKLADFVIVEENPLENFKALYGTGAIKLTENNEVVRVGGVKYTIKDGIIYDAKALLKEVEIMVDQAKSSEQFKIIQPGMKK